MPSPIPYKSYKNMYANFAHHFFIFWLVLISVLGRAMFVTVLIFLFLFITKVYIFGKHH